MNHIPPRPGAPSAEELRRMVLVYEYREELLQKLVDEHAKGELSCKQFTRRYTEIVTDNPVPQLSESLMGSSPFGLLSPQRPPHNLPHQVFSPGAKSNFSQNRLPTPEPPAWGFGSDDSDSDDCLSLNSDEAILSPSIPLSLEERLANSDPLDLDSP
mmetsp:Transcript_20489/g.78554  ORF Transcript_20489/g.78554 Transcript_20489/m.78554 type:complete len:157 (+) Transcript_20489:101-571(+)